MHSVHSQSPALVSLIGMMGMNENIYIAHIETNANFPSDIYIYIYMYICSRGTMRKSNYYNRISVCYIIMV
jgi:hypothetical protein